MAIDRTLAREWVLSSPRPWGSGAGCHYGGFSARSVDSATSAEVKPGEVGSDTGSMSSATSGVGGRPHSDEPSDQCSGPSTAAGRTARLDGRHPAGERGSHR